MNLEFDLDGKTNHIQKGILPNEMWRGSAGRNHKICPMGISIKTKIFNPMVRKWLHPPGSGICDAFLQIPIKIWEKIWTTKSDCFSQVGFHRDLAAANWFVKSLTCFSGNPWNFPIWIWPWPNPKNKLRRVSHPRTSSCAFRQLLREMHPPYGEESTPTNSTDHARLDAVLRSIGPASVRGYTQPTLFQSNISQPFFNQTERYEHESLAIQALDFRESSVPTLRAKSCQQIGRWEIYI